MTSALTATALTWANVLGGYIAQGRCGVYRIRRGTKVHSLSLNNECDLTRDLFYSVEAAKARAEEMERGASVRCAVAT